VRCELIPQASRCYFVPGARLEDLIDFCLRAERLRLGDELLVLNSTQLALMFGSGNGEFDAVRRAQPQWVVIINLAGAAYYPEERVTVQEQELKSLAQAYGCDLLSSLPGIPDSGVKSMLEDCSSEPYWKLGRKGGCQELFFLTTLDKAPQFTATVQAAAETCEYPLPDIGVYIQPQHHGVSQHVEFDFPYDPDDAQEAAVVKRLYETASEALISQGAYFSRPYGLWADLVYSRDATAKRVLTTVKQIVDPRNVLNPGKLCF
jgi:FAD/FMN-containing dehydrogenase